MDENIFERDERQRTSESLETGNYIKCIKLLMQNKSTMYIPKTTPIVTVRATQVFYCKIDGS